VPVQFQTGQNLVIFIPESPTIRRAMEGCTWDKRMCNQKSEKVKKKKINHFKCFENVGITTLLLLNLYNILIIRFTSVIKVSVFKGLVHPKMKIKSLITHTHAVPTP